MNLFETNLSNPFYSKNEGGQGAGQIKGMEKEKKREGNAN